MSYVLYGLIIAALAIVIIYFSKVEEDEKPKSKRLAIEAPPPETNPEVEQLKQRLNDQISHHDREYQQTLIQVREAENNRRIEYAKMVDQVKNVENQLNREKDTLMVEKQEFLKQKLEADKATPKKPRKSRTKKESHEEVD